MPVDPGTVREMQLRGRALRRTITLSDHGPTDLPERDVVALLEHQHRDRVPELVPVRVGRMIRSPASFYRAGAAQMAHDLAGAPVTGLEVVACGDAHLANFGLFASPERRVVFDLNDFDEAGYGPWEWDVKRLAASVHVTGRTLGHSEEASQDAALAVVRSYRTAMRDLTRLSALERYHLSHDAQDFAERAGKQVRHRVQGAVDRARRRTSERYFARSVSTADGMPRIVDAPPVTEHVPTSVAPVDEVLERYRATVRPDVALLLGQFTLVDWVRRVVGVGSVGTRCYLLLLMGPAGAPLFLQVKEAQRSVLQAYGGRAGPMPVPASAADHEHQGFRVVTGQRILQAHSDPLLGWVDRVDDGTGVRRDYYVRQFRDMKGSVRVDELSAAELELYAGVCGQVLARAHSQSPGGAVIAGYLGSADVFDEAVARWARDCADHNEQDLEAVSRAVSSGRLPCEPGV